MGEFGSCIALFQAETESPERARSPRAAARGVRRRELDLERAQAHLRGRGIEFRFEDHGNAHSLYVPDPDGNVIELTTYDEEQDRRRRTSRSRSGVSTRIGARAHLEELAAVLVDRVEGGASVGYLAPFPHDEARRVYEEYAADVERGRRVLLGRSRTGRSSAPPRSSRTASEPAAPGGRLARARAPPVSRRGIARASWSGPSRRREREEGRRSCLDAVTGGDAERLYERLGWVKVGVIPNYASTRTGGPATRRTSGRRCERSGRRLGGEAEDQAVRSERDVELGQMPTPSSSTQPAWGSQSSQRAAARGHGKTRSAVPHTIRTGHAILAASSGQPTRCPCSISASPGRKRRHRGSGDEEVDGMCSKFVVV